MYTSRMTAMNPSGAAMDASGMHAAAVKSAAAATGAATSATASIGIVRDQAYGKQNDCCKRNQNITEHDSYLPTIPPRTETPALSPGSFDVDQRNLSQLPQICATSGHAQCDRFAEES